MEAHGAKSVALTVSYAYTHIGNEYIAFTVQCVSCDIMHSIEN